MNLYTQTYTYTVLTCSHIDTFMFIFHFLIKNISSITFLTWSICGFGSQTKKIKVLNLLNKLKADMCLLQETERIRIRYYKIKLKLKYNKIKLKYNH